MKRLWYAAAWVVLAAAAFAQPVSPRVLTMSKPPIQTPVESSHDKKPEASKPEANAPRDDRGPDAGRLVVEVAPSPGVYPESEGATKDRKNKAFDDHWTFIAVAVTAVATLALALVTGLLWIATYRLYQTTAKAVSDGERSIKAALDAAKAAGAHVAETSRAANAMERVAIAMSDNVEIVRDVAKVNKEIADRQAKLWPLQMRPYISVMIGSAVYQDTAISVKFEGKPVLVNRGATPAYNVRYSIRADILPIPLPESMGFSAHPPSGKGHVVAPNADGVMSAVVDRIFFEGEVPDIKQGKGRALTVWGRIEYADIFGESHYTNFCQVLLWRADDTIYGYHQSAHSDAN